jgi:putative glycerol-1-phosphate prenyltransferase
MDGGSGAKYSVPEDVIRETKKISNIPLIIGGGIRNPEEAREKVKAGADFIVTGSVIEKEPFLLKSFPQAIHFQ